MLVRRFCRVGYYTERTVLHTARLLMSLIEYVYVDEKRLDAYFEQISSPVTYDKVPEWNADISITGPKAGGSNHDSLVPLLLTKRPLS